MPQIFLLEDDAALGRGIAMALSGPDRAVTQADTVARAREALARATFDLPETFSGKLISLMERFL